MTRDFEQTPGQGTQVEPAEQTQGVPGRTTRTVEQPHMGGVLGAPGTPLYLHVTMRERIREFVQLREQVARVAAGSPGPGADAMRAQLATRATELSAYLLEIAPEIRQHDHPALNALAIEAVREIERAPIPRNNPRIAQNLSTAAGILEVVADTGGLSTATTIAGVFGGVASLFAAAEHVVEGRGTAGEAVTAAGAILGMIAAARGSTPMGIAALVIDQIGSAVGDGIRDQRDRDAVQQALLQAGVHPNVARAIANAEPQIMRELRDNGLTSLRVAEIAQIAPNILTNGNPVLTPQIIRQLRIWGNDSPFTGERLRILRMWNDQLR